MTFPCFCSLHCYTDSARQNHPLRMKGKLVSNFYSFFHSTFLKNILQRMKPQTIKIETNSCKLILFKVEIYIQNYTRFKLKQHNTIIDSIYLSKQKNILDIRCKDLENLQGQGKTKDFYMVSKDISYPSSKFSGIDDTELIHQGVREGRKRNKFGDPETNWESQPSLD